MALRHFGAARFGAARRFGAWTVASWLAVLCLGAPAAAQSPATSPVFAPQMLTPESASPASPSPPETAPKTPDPDTAAPPIVPKPPADEIKVQTLAPLDPDGVGLLVPPEGLGAELWTGSERATLEQILPRLPVRTVSRTARDLQRRILLSAAPTPPNRMPSNAGVPSLVRVRVEKLFAMGNAQEAAALARLAPERVDGPLGGAVRAEAALLAGEIAAACAEAPALVRDSRDTFGQKLGIFCALKGPNARLGLALEVLKEQDGTDPAFFALASAMQGNAIKFESLPQATPLHLAMLRTANLRPPADIASSPHAGVLAAVARNAAVEGAVRAAAGERAEEQGALGANELAQIYGALEFTPAELAQPARRADSAYDSRARALLFAAARGQIDPAAQALALERMLNYARAKGGYAQAARVAATLVALMAPAPALASFAPEAMRTLLVAQDFARAKPWLEAARARPGASAAIGVLAQLAGIESAADSTVLGQWWTGIVGREGAVMRAGVVFTLYDALGAKVEPRLWRQLLSGAPPSAAASLPALPYLAGLTQAGTAKRRGDTALFALSVFGEAGAAGAHPIALGEAVAALRAAGFEAEARRFSLEAAFAAGL